MLRWSRLAIVLLAVSVTPSLAGKKNKRPLAVSTKSKRPSKPVVSLKEPVRPPDQLPPREVIIPKDRQRALRGMMTSHSDRKKIEPIVEGPIIEFLSREDRELMGEVTFTHKAIWARPLPGQWWMETIRAFMDLVTIGFFEFSRMTAGHCYHWAFVARASRPADWRPWYVSLSDKLNNKDTHPYVYLVIQDNWMLPKGWRKVVNLQKEMKFYGDKHKHKICRFTVHAATSPQEALEVMGCGRGKGFVKAPRSGYGKNPRHNLDRSWVETKMPRKYDKIMEMVRMVPSTKKVYSIDKNNCQHFASWLYHDKKDGKHARKNKVRKNAPYII